MKYFEQGRLMELATQCGIDDGVSMGGGGGGGDEVVINVDADQAAPSGGGEVERFVGVNDNPEDADLTAPAGGEDEVPTIYAGRSGVVDAAKAPPTAGQQSGAQQQPAPGQTPEQQAQAAAQEQVKSVLAKPEVQAILQPIQQQNQMLMQTLQYTQQMQQALQQENQNFRQQLVQMAQQASQRQVDAQRAAAAPRPPPPEAPPEEHLRYENRLLQFNYDQKLAEFDAKLNGYQQAAQEQLQVMQEQAVQRQQAYQQAQYRAQYDQGMAKIREAANYKPFLNDNAWVDQKTGQRANIGEHVFSTLYNSWASSAMEQARANGQAYSPPDPVPLANLLNTWIEAIVQQRMNPGKQQAVQTQQVQQQRAAQQQRNTQMRGVTPMKSQPSAGASNGKDKEAIRNKWLPAVPGERAIFGGN